MKILITGAAGFIGNHLAIELLNRGDEVVGLDNINDYYDQNVKYGRLQRAGLDIEEIKKDKGTLSGNATFKIHRSTSFADYKFVKVNLEAKEAMMHLFKTEKFDAVYNLAAQAGARYSLTNPDAYVESNIVGFMNILECCRHNGVKNLCCASSSSVYGLNEELPFSTEHNVDHPISLYAASKKSSELMAHTYSHLYHIPTTGLRFFYSVRPLGKTRYGTFPFYKSRLRGQKHRCIQ